MKILETKELEIPDIKVIKFARFHDDRGFFSPKYVDSVIGLDLKQMNESFSRENVMRGLHFQWNPYQGKLVRTVQGHMVDMVLDIRRDSPYFGKIILYDMPQSSENDFSEWIWVPPGFAHGNFFTEDTTIEYLCDGEWSPGTEAGISPLSGSIDWSICDSELKDRFDQLVPRAVLTDKDRHGLEFEEWAADEKSENFLYHELKTKEGIKC